jgi:CheY-like chemotaxis protein
MPPSAPALALPRVLYVEDDPETSRLVAHLMEADPESPPLTVTAVRDGDEALRELEGGGYTLIITDLDHSGTAAPALLRAARRRHCAALVITAQAGREAELTLLGATGVVVKPVDREAFLTLLWATLDTAEPTAATATGAKPERVFTLRVVLTLLALTALAVVSVWITYNP